MKASRHAFAVCAATLAVAAPIYAQQAETAASVGATHEALRVLKQEAEDAFNAMGRSGELSDLERLLDLVHDDIVLAAMNGRIARGKDGIIEYFMASMTGPGRTVQSVEHTFDVAELTTLYGDDTGVAYGTTHGAYELTNGLSFEVDANWTATMVNENGRWLLASFQFAPSIFDNPILDRTLSSMYWGIGIAGVVGLVVGFLVGRRSRVRARVGSE